MLPNFEMPVLSFIDGDIFTGDLSVAETKKGEGCSTGCEGGCSNGCKGGGGVGSSDC
jgi:hypothetical protein